MLLNCMVLMHLIWLTGSQERIYLFHRNPLLHIVIDPRLSHLLDPTEIWRYAQLLVIPSLIETNGCLRYAKVSRAQIQGLNTMQVFKFMKEYGVFCGYIAIHLQVWLFWRYMIWYNFLAHTQFWSFFHKCIFYGWC